MITLDNIRAKLQEAIKQNELTQSALAKKIGVHYTAVGQYMSGRSMPALDTFAKICAVLEIDANEILCVSDFKEE